MTETAPPRPAGALAWLRQRPRDARDAFWIAAVIGGLVGLVLAPLAIRSGAGSDSDFGGYAHDGYVELARSLARGDGFVFEPGGTAVSHRPPLYPLMLAPLMLLPEALQRPALTLIQVLLLAAAVSSTFKLGARWFDSDTARLASRLMLVNPWLYWMTCVAMSPLLQLALFIWLLRALFARGDGERVSSASPWAGPLAAGLALTHGAMALTLVMLFGVAGLLALRRGLPALRNLVLAGLLTAACIAPWTLRNYLVFHRLIPVATNAGFAYFAGSAHWGQGPLTGKLSPEMIYGTPAGEEGLYLAGLPLRYEDVAHFYGLRDVDLDAQLGTLAVAHAREDLPRLARKMGLNFLEDYFPITFSLVRHPSPSFIERLMSAKLRLARSIFYAGWWLLVLLSLRARPAGRGLETGLLWIFVAAYVLPYLPFLTFAAHSMYNFGSLPCLAILGARGWRAVRPQPQLAAA